MCKHSIEFADKLTDIHILHNKAKAVAECLIDQPHDETLVFVVHDYLQEANKAFDNLYV